MTFASLPLESNELGGEIMAKQTRFYLGRVLKRGEMNADRIVAVVAEPVTIEYRGTRYSFIDFEPTSGL